VAQKIQVLTNGRFTRRLDGPDQSYWDSLIDGNLYTIHREHYLGVSMFSNASDARKTFDRIERELMI
jgi:hypothetical protein